MTNEKTKELLEAFFEFPDDPPQRWEDGSLWLPFDEAEEFYTLLPAEYAAVGTMRGHIRLVDSKSNFSPRVAHHVTRIFKDLYDHDPELVLNAHRMINEMQS